MSPHVTTLPLFFKAANAPSVEYIATTSEDKLAATVVESPPE